MVVVVGAIEEQQIGRLYSHIKVIGVRGVNLRHLSNFRIYCSGLRTLIRSQREPSFMAGDGRKCGTTGNSFVTSNVSD